MFHLPEAKRVRREDLNPSDDSAWSEQDGEGRDDAELRARLNAQIARSLGLDDDGDAAVTGVRRAEPSARQVSSEAQEVSHEDEDGDDGDEEFAFRLFSTAQPAQKVILEADVEPQGDGGFVVPARPLSHYIITDLSERQRQEYGFAAMSGEEVLSRANSRYWGLQMPWRVTRITVTRKCKSGEASQDTTGRRRRPGKKQRISLRKRAKAVEEESKATAQKLAEKEEHIKDKKKRMNRLKKLRKRAKNKEAKAAAREGDDGSGDESAGGE